MVHEGKPYVSEAALKRATTAALVNEDRIGRVASRVIDQHDACRNGAAATPTS